MGRACPMCAGSGYVTIRPAEPVKREPCPSCDATGWLIDG